MTPNLRAVAKLPTESISFDTQILTVKTHDLTFCNHILRHRMADIPNLYRKIHRAIATTVESERIVKPDLGCLDPRTLREFKRLQRRCNLRARSIGRDNCSIRLPDRLLREGFGLGQGSIHRTELTTSDNRIGSGGQYNYKIEGKRDTLMPFEVMPPIPKCGRAAHWRNRIIAIAVMMVGATSLFVGLLGLAAGKSNQDFNFAIIATVSGIAMWSAGLFILLSVLFPLCLPFSSFVSALAVS